MGSSRFPGKVMKMVNKRPLISYMIERVKRSKTLDKVIIATTKNIQDDIIVEWCKINSVDYFRGSEEDVLERYYFAAKINNLKLIIRLTADCPLIDPVIIDKLVKVYKKLSSNSIDFVSNSVPPESTFPDGMDVEVFNFDLLEKAYNEANLPSEREHVTFFMWKSGLFKTHRVDSEVDYSKYRFTIDYEVDYKVVESIIEGLYSKQKIFIMEDIIDYFNDNSSIQSLQDNIIKYEGWQASLEKDDELLKKRKRI